VKIVCIARLTEKKGHKYLIESFSNIVKVRPNTELLIIGEGRLKDMLQKQISDLNLQDKAKILDFISFRDVADILYNHHIFCLPSITAANGDQEGIPNVLKEACATGMPVVSTYHAGIPLLIKDGKNGFLVKEKDTAQLTDRLLFLVDHPEIWESMGQWGRNHVEENFERFKQAKKVEKLYSDVLKSTKRKR
jgi:colanic acid/amylovoran biosynthesis glycosyltransferase